MFNRKKIKRRSLKFNRRPLRLFRLAINPLMHLLLRGLYIFGKRFRVSQSGFVLPTITIILLILSLIVGSVLIRSANRTSEVIGQQENQRVYNAATPAIERAKAKIEAVFQDPNITTGVPPESTLAELLKDTRYTFNDETRVDINGGGTDNAWVFESDLDANGTNETVAYSIMVNAGADTNGDGTEDITLEDSTLEQKAENLITRTGPISLQTSTEASINCPIPEQKIADGWYSVDNASVSKNFQIDVVVANNNTSNKALTAIELQQDRTINKGNKWGAWFRYDLENYPGPQFNWNGAMHTESNLIIGRDSSFNAYLVSSPFSCFYSQDAAEISVTRHLDKDGNTEFEGQAIAGDPRQRDNFNGTSYYDLFPGQGIAPTGSNSKVAMSKSTDSVLDSKENGETDFNNLTVDPIRLFTEDKFQARGSDTTNTSARDSNWKNSDLAKRIATTNESIPPYVDDTYRADDRWGPNPLYELRNKEEVELSITEGRGNGDEITQPEYEYELTNNDPPDKYPDEVGLDGYWERRARVEGMRVIVGQRLELGNAYGWKGSGNTNARDDDPLYPPNQNTTNLVRQRRSIRDNLAAVQATAIYHSDFDRDFPVACLATTAHPGTQTTVKNSTFFNNFPGTNNINTNFLIGEGTNGWEFEPPADSNDAFAIKINNTNDPLRIALDNLARFAGDPEGAFPAKQESALPIVHPYPYLTMWGDFSNLRRAMEQLDASSPTPKAYADLSLADQTTLQTASCMLGMLGYNLDNLQDLDYSNSNVQAALTTLDTALVALNNSPSSNGTGGEVDLTTNGLQVNRIYPNEPSSSWIDYSPDPLLGPDAFINALSDTTYLSGLSIGSAGNISLRDFARLIQLKEQVQRDRRFGFANVTSTNAGTFSYITGLQAIPYSYPTNKAYSSTSTVLGCDLTDNNYFGFGNPADPLNLVGDLDGNGILNAATDRILAQQRIIRLASVFCSAKPKFPSLYYIFPAQDHDHDGDVADNDSQPTTEQYIDDPNDYIASSDVNGSYEYKTVEPDAIAIAPRSLTNEWKLPTIIPATRNPSGVNEIKAPDGTFVYLSFLDKGFYDGRQLMQTRTLDFDLNLLRTTLLDTDYWLPNSGIVYAFREDAIREDAIIRPSSASWNSCNEDTEIASANCRMNLNVTAPQDPPFNDLNGISPKPVDYYPDPDRRAYGFRLRNGANLSRGDSPNGLSLISDGPVYIQGNLNLHSTNGTTSNRLEEFTTTLSSNWSNFYNRGNSTSTRGLNEQFAKSSGDTWRPTEIFGDGLTVLAENFCDGTMEHGMRNTNVSTSEVNLAGDSNIPDLGCNTANAPTSYQNSTLASSGNSNWQRENPFDAGSSLNSPILVDRNANMYQFSGFTTFTNYRGVTSGRSVVGAQETWINSILINGLVPSRKGQSYGGFHNFPRFIQNWDGTNLNISGSFIQINFSTYATGPFDQDAWEPDQSPVSNQVFQFYGAPNRRWGYDVALLYNPPGPIAERFVSLGIPRSEVYQELAADDPYIKQLRCVNVNGTTVDPNATDCN